jgi:hypothetical protein
LHLLLLLSSRSRIVLDFHASFQYYNSCWLEEYCFG